MSDHQRKSRLPFGRDLRNVVVSQSPLGIVEDNAGKARLGGFDDVRFHTHVCASRVLNTDMANGDHAALLDPNHLVTVANGVTATTSFAALLGYLPPLLAAIASLLSILWFALQLLDMRRRKHQHKNHKHHVHSPPEAPQSGA